MTRLARTSLDSFLNYIRDGRRGLESAEIRPSAEPAQRHVRAVPIPKHLSRVYLSHVQTRLGVAAILVALAMLAAGCASSDSGKTEAKAAPRDSFPVGSRASFRVDAHCGVEWAGSAPLSVSRPAPMGGPEVLTLDVRSSA